MKRKISNLIIVLIFFTGLSLLLYPVVSDYWNSLHQTRAVAGYTEQTEHMDETDYNKLLKDAEEYNKTLIGKDGRYRMSEAEKAEYKKLLYITDDGIMACIEIPVIRCSLPVYHGVDDEILQVAVGHLPGSSLPVGGESTHCVISGHRGLPSAKLFTNLDKLTEGDIFSIRVLNEIHTYEIDQIRIVLPEELDDLEIYEGKDYCTLVTCTPYGINTHRLLVRGIRNDALADADASRITTEALQIDPILVTPVVALPLLLILLAIYFIGNKRRKR